MQEAGLAAETEENAGKGKSVSLSTHWRRCFFPLVPDNPPLSPRMAEKRRLVLEHSESIRSKGARLLD